MEIPGGWIKTGETPLEAAKENYLKKPEELNWIEVQNVKRFEKTKVSLLGKRIFYEL